MPSDRGPLDTYEIVWASGHVEHIKAHQVIAPPSGVIKASSPGIGGWMFHGEIEGHWRLLLSARSEDIVSVRNVSHTRDMVGGRDGE